MNGLVGNDQQRKANVKGCLKKGYLCNLQLMTESMAVNLLLHSKEVFMMISTEVERNNQPKTNKR